ncbi:glycosyltransferase family 4 protein [Paractinoplanes ferrugineus]|uniref:Glycosyl transferase n=1 Tax=Paractinoplanes ferrugineus TaxID=113564 RepID=A0A919IVH8_9ACTN|nr:glycosyltransferase family 4 protein [Actinoplanes ferrugineus]GIE08888.1 glycosyl transferase [Actinoplanes ferrugineus]
MTIRVLLVSHYYPPHVGGIENVVHQQATHLARQGADVTVLTSGPRSTSTTDGGVRVIRQAAWNGIERRTGVPFPVLGPGLLATARRWARWADVIHVHDCLYPTSWAAGLAAVLTRTPYLLTQHVGLVAHPSVLVRGGQRVVYRIAGRPLLRRAARVLVVNGKVGEFVRDQGVRQEDVALFANGVDSTLFRPIRSDADRVALRQRLGLPAEKLLVLFVGRLVEKKGYDLLLNAADPAYELVFAGDGSDLRRFAGRPGVHHLGALPPAELADVYRACDVFALPSESEGFPLTVQEAMASGLPVVTTDDPGYAPYGLAREHVTLLPRDAGRLRAALRAIAGDAARRERAGAWSRRFAMTNFAWDEHATGLLRTYDLVGGA